MRPRFRVPVFLFHHVSAQPRFMNWIERPTAPGYYWARHISTGVTVPVRVDATRDGLRVREFGVPEALPLDFPEWRQARWLALVPPGA